MEQSNISRDHIALEAMKIIFNNFIYIFNVDIIIFNIYIIKTSIYN